MGPGRCLHGPLFLGQVEEDDHGHRALAGRLDGREIHAAERLPSLDSLVDLDVHRERRPLELDGVDAHVDKDLEALVGADPKGMRRLGDHDDGSSARRDDVVSARCHGEPVAHRLRGENGVWHIGDGDHRAGERRDDATAQFGF